ncbi:MAG TPA: hypothetical protein VF175_14555, partial [Lacipirellula sp.]
ATQNSSVFGMGFDFANPGADAANALQLGIWQGMGYSASEIYSLAGWTTTKQNTLISMYLGAPGGSTGWLTTFVPTAPMVLGVQIMNLHTFQFDSSGSEVLPPPDGRRIKMTGRAQDQLIYTPQEVIVPELPSFLTGLTSIAVAGLCSVLAQMRRLRQPAGDVAA